MKFCGVVIGQYKGKSRGSSIEFVQDQIHHANATYVGHLNTYGSRSCIEFNLNPFSGRGLTESNMTEVASEQSLPGSSPLDSGKRTLGRGSSPPRLT